MLSQFGKASLLLTILKVSVVLRRCTWFLRLSVVVSVAFPSAALANFVVVNKSNSTVYVAIMQWVGMHFSGGYGSDSEHWMARGWHSVNPGEKGTILRGGTDNGWLYVRIESNRQPIIPVSSNGTGSMCISESGFLSKQYASDDKKGRDFYTLDIENGRQRRQGRCQDIGGHFETFWQMKANTTFTVN